MKVFVALAIICLGSTFAIPDVREIKQEILNNFIAKLKAKHPVSAKLSDARFPVLPPLPLPDPLVIPDWSFELPENDIGAVLAASMRNGALEGLTDWSDDLKLNLLTQRVTYNGDLKSVKLSADHSFKASIPYIIIDLTASAEGALLAQVDGAHFDVGFTLAVNLTTTRVYVKNVVLNLGFDSATYFAENAEFVDVPINWDLVNEYVKLAFDANWAVWKPDLENVLTQVLNEIVGRYTLAEIIEFIIGIGKPKTTTTAAPILLQ
jgi:hypothetical protein